MTKLAQKSENTGQNAENAGRSQRLGRNDPCPCGSGKKYKKCCLDNVQTHHHQHDEHEDEHHHCEHC